MRKRLAVKEVALFGGSRWEMSVSRIDYSDGTHSWMVSGNGSATFFHEDELQEALEIAQELANMS